MRLIEEADAEEARNTAPGPALTPTHIRGEASRGLGEPRQESGADRGVCPVRATQHREGPVRESSSFAHLILGRMSRGM